MFDLLGIPINDDTLLMFAIVAIVIVYVVVRSLSVLDSRNETYREVERKDDEK